MRLARLGLILIVAVDSAAGAPPAVAAQPGIQGDVTATATGQDLARASAARFAARGLAVVPASLVVIQDSAGYLVVPAGTVLEGTDVKAPRTASGPQAGLSSGVGVSPLVADSWRLVNNACFSRVSDTFSWIDHCYKLYKDSETANGSKDFFLLEHYATAGPNSPWAVDNAKISSSQASSSSTMTWVDWSPKGSWSGSSCSSGSVGVSAPITFTVNVTFCEHWDMTKDNPAVNFALRWWTGPTGIHETRGLEYMNSVSVVQNGWPVWVLPAEVNGSLY